MRDGASIRHTLERGLGLGPAVNERAANVKLGPNHPLARLLARRRLLTIQVTLRRFRSRSGTARGVDSASLIRQELARIRFPLAVPEPVAQSRAAA